MKLDNFVPFGRPQSGTVIIQLMTELDVSANFILEQQYQTHLECKTMRFFSTKNRMSQCTYFENIYLTVVLEMPSDGIFVKHTLCFLYFNQKKFCKQEQRE